MTDYFIDNTNKSGDLTSATGWTFTNGSATITCPGGEGDANNEIGAGDYVKAEGGTQWYKVATVDAGGDSFTIDIVFQQANVGPVACNYSDVSTNDGTAIGLAWPHPALYTTDTVRSAGDIGKMRANQVHVLAGKTLNFDEDGSADERISLKGVDSVDDPWTDGSDVHVIFDFSDTAFQCTPKSDHFWSFENIDGIQSSNTSGFMYFQDANGGLLVDCVFRDNGGAGVRCHESYTSIEDCEFYSNTNRGLYLTGSPVTVKRSNFNGGAAGTSYGIAMTSTSTVDIEDCTFGVDTAHDISSINPGSAGVQVAARRCLFSDSVEFSPSSLSRGSSLKSEDHNQVEGAHKTFFFEGTTEKETTEVRPGGAASSIKITPDSDIGLYAPILCMKWEEQAVPASIQTRGVAIKVTTNPGSYPANTELYLEAEYYDHATNDTVATVVSTAVLSANDTWTWFPVSFTPAQAQKVRYRVYLKTQENAESYYIDNQLYDSNPI